MRVLLVLVSMFLATMSTAAVEQTLVFVNGTRMAIQSYEVKSGTVQFTTIEGRLQSVPRSYVNLVATEEVNGGGGSEEPASAPVPPPPPPTPAPAPVAPALMPTETVASEPPIAQPAPTPTPAPTPPPAPVAASPDMNLGASPPPVWSNEELQVSLVVPSASWRMEDMPPSFDVAVALDNSATEARATLALIRQELRGKKEFQRVVANIETSIASAPGYRRISTGAVDLDPYQAHEFRFTKNIGFVSVYNRLVVVYSRDLAYVLSLTCPESRVAENESDFEALTRGLVIKKSRSDLTF
ncbi:MAG: hypothetical protein BMS9Abin37_0641 [Acidobacteriota bacterium]|nr:MAG: hypothetical protein BMS9Abin37_0641 [Acidobacteriota bacterium]